MGKCGAHNALRARIFDLLHNFRFRLKEFSVRVFGHSAGFIFVHQSQFCGSVNRTRAENAGQKWIEFQIKIKTKFSIHVWHSCTQPQESEKKWNWKMLPSRLFVFWSARFLANIRWSWRAFSSYTTSHITRCQWRPTKFHISYHIWMDFCVISYLSRCELRKQHRIADEWN